MYRTTKWNFSISNFQLKEFKVYLLWLVFKVPLALFNIDLWTLLGNLLTIYVDDDRLLKYSELILRSIIFEIAILRCIDQSSAIKSCIYLFEIRLKIHKNETLREYTGLYHKK